MEILRTSAREVQIFFEENEVTEKLRSFVSDFNRLLEANEGWKNLQSFVMMFRLFFEENEVTESLKNLDFELSFEGKKAYGTFPTLGADFETHFKEKDVSNFPYPS